MKNRTIIFTVMAAVVWQCTLYADVVIINPVGTGAKALSLANNFTALSNDVSGNFWNPAALSFVPVREFQASFDVLNNHNEASFFGTTTDSDIRRMRLANLGFLFSVPATKGGLTFAGSIQNPYIFDDNPSFSGTYSDTGNRSISLSQKYKGYGSLTYWSGSFGLQVAPGLGVGASLSLVSGSEKLRWIFTKETDGTIVNIIRDDFDRTIDRGYVGYDIRLALLYAITEKVRLGARFSLPQQIWFSEDFNEVNQYANQPQYSEQSNGRLLSSYSGAIGVAAVLPFMTVTSEFRARAPYDMVYPDEQIPSSSPARRTKIGAGLGIETPLFNSKMLVRGGYSWDQYDPFIFVRKYDNNTINWNTDGLNSDKNRNLLSTGLAYVLNNWCIEGGYGYQFWTLDTKGTLTEDHGMHRFVLSVSVHY